ncbi:MAG: hypothetical protein ACC726_06815 [Chloroflexota bacterium]
MLWPLKFMFKLVLRLKLIAVSMLAGMAIAFYLQLREQQKSWGVVPTDVKRSLAGDDLIANPGVVETRSLVVDAAPAAVWPWLVQMGYGRGGWYSYDKLDIKGNSADSILADFQELAVDDIVPTHSGGGFVVKVVDPGRALVLYLDDELVKSQMEAAIAEKGDAALDDIDQILPGGMRLPGGMGDKTMPEFRATWTFILEPEAGGKTRLVERFRVWTAEAGLPQKLGMPMMGLGVFAMTRKHMLGVKERAEGAISNGADAPADSEPVEA